MNALRKAPGLHVEDGGDYFGEGVILSGATTALSSFREFLPVLVFLAQCGKARLVQLGSTFLVIIVNAS